MTLEKPASKLGTYELLKEQPGIGVGSLWIARTSGDAAEAPELFSVIRVHKHLTKKPEAAEAVVADTKMATTFRHPNAVALLDAGLAGGELYLAFERHEGETLTALLAAAGAQGLPQAVVLRIALDVLAALGAAHTHDPLIHHGELGPQHVIVGVDGVARLGGLATAPVLSRLGAPVGVKNQERLSYAAPERVKSMASPTVPAPPPAPSADVFSMGVMLWEALSRQRLFTSKIDAAIVQKVLTGPIAALGSIAGISVPAPLEEAVKKALERDPAKRTPSAAALAAALEPLGSAAREEVSAEVERLAGKAIAARKAEVRAEITKRAASKSATTIPPPAAPKPAGMMARKATLLGIVTPVAKPAAAAPTEKPAEKEAAAPAEKEAAAPGQPVPLKLALPPPPPLDPPEPPKPARPPAESLNLEDIEVAAPVAPAAPHAPPAPRRPLPGANKRGVTLLMGAPVSPAESPKPAVTAGGTPKPAATTGEPAKPAPPKPVVTMGEPAKPPAAKAEDGEKPSEKPTVVPPPGAAAASPQFHDVPSPSKTAHTPASDGPSPRSKGAVAVEKVGPGSTLGRYEILMPVARGGMASVWAAKLPGTRGFQKIFAIKTMLPDVSDDPEFESMFLDEARVAARIRHPNVVEIIDLGEQSEVLYLVMEWVEGENLGTLVKAARGLGGVPMPLILRIASQICAGLHAAHDLRDDDGNLIDLVHRDISPANVLVSTSGFVKIVDFGIAKSKGRLHVTRIGGTVKGKTPYLSPEQLGQQPLDRRSDIFSLGVLLYVLATGLHPFRGETDTKTIENIALRDAVPLRAIASAVPAELEAIVLKALAKDPDERFATAGEMQRALDHAAATLGYTTTEEDVAAFVRKALGDTLSKRAQELRAAIERADGRAPGEGESSKPSTAVVAPNPAAVADLAAPPAEPAKPAPRPAAEPAPKPAAEADVPVEEEISFEGVSPFPRPRHPDSVTMPAISPAGAGGDGDALEAALFATPPPGEEAAARASRASDASNAPIEVEGTPRRRKSVALIAVGAVIGLCVLIGAVALLTSGKKDVATGTTEAATATATAAPAPPPPATTPPPAPAPPPPAPEPPPAATATATTPPAPEPPAPDTATAAGSHAKVPRSGPASTKPPSTSKPRPKPKYDPSAP